MTASINLPVLVVVSRVWLPEMDSTSRLTFLASSRATIAAVRQAMGTNSNWSVASVTPSPPLSPLSDHEPEYSE